MSQRNRRSEQQHGILVLDKPQGPTSTQCLERIKKELNQKKIGHAGTLDPLATGVLLVALGRATKLTPYLVEGTKVYSGWIRLGLTTDTYDIQGEVQSEGGWRTVPSEAIRREIAAWRDMSEHSVPPFSAAKHKGTPHYRMARRGEEPPQKTKPVHIDRAEVLAIELPFVQFRVACSKGTYIRSLAHSLGTRLGCGAVLSELRREESHPFGLDRAVGLESLLHAPNALPERVLSIPEALPHWPTLYLSSEQAAGIKNGNWLKADELRGMTPAGQGERALFVTTCETPIALVETRLWRGQLYWAILRGLWPS
jgi:tRNA pseudouridine55 synthase